MVVKVLRDNCIFIFAVMSFLTSCQTTNIGEKNVSVLDEDPRIEKIEQTNQTAKSENDIAENPDEKLVQTEIEPIVEQETPVTEPYENIASAQKIKDEKRILDFFSDLFKSDEDIEKKTEIGNIKESDFAKKKIITSNKEKVDNKYREKQTEIFKQEQPKDEKRILDFFTKFFESNENSENKIIDKDTSVRNDKIIIKKPNDNEKQKKELDENIEQVNSEINEMKRNKYKEANDFKEEFTITESKNRSSKKIEIKEIFDDELEIQDKTEDLAKNEKFIDKSVELNESLKQDNIKETKDLAFLDTRRSIYKKKKRSNNLIGLLLPLTGEKRSAGKLVLNTFRYSLVSNPKDIVFKVYDTKGTSIGAVEAAKKGKNDNVDTFIGPVFSDETFAIKNAFVGDNKVKFFSLSPDLSNISRNVIVSGQNPKDQVSCILNDIESKKLKKILLIHHNDRYGEVVKKNLEERILKLDMSNQVDLSFFTVYPEQNLNKDIMAISNFESRKLALKEKRQSIENDKSLSKFERKKELKKLERQLTLGVPFDSVIIASDGDRLTEILSHLAFYDINANNTFIYGTSLWEDTNKNDKVFENTFFVSNLKSKESSFVSNYKDVFSRDPSSVSFHLFDLIDLVNDSKFYDIYPEDKVYFGEYTNSLLKSGYIKRETFIKKNKAGKTKNVFSCQLSEI